VPACRVSPPLVEHPLHVVQTEPPHERGHGFAPRAVLAVLERWRANTHTRAYVRTPSHKQGGTLNTFGLSFFAIALV
jgi:hypothetical protein